MDASQTTSQANPASQTSSPWAEWANTMLGGSGLWQFPTADLEQVEKKIKELRTVLGWMEMQCKMLEMTIHALEVQQGTLRALQALRIDPQVAAAATAQPAGTQQNRGAAADGAQATPGQTFAPIQQWWQEALAQMPFFNPPGADAAAPATHQARPAKQTAPRKPRARARSRES